MKNYYLSSTFFFYFFITFAAKYTQVSAIFRQEHNRTTVELK